MLLMQKVGLWIRDKFTLYHVLIVTFQFFGAFVVAVTSPLLIRFCLKDFEFSGIVSLCFEFGEKDKKTLK